jgi:hypothetical protein
LGLLDKDVRIAARLALRVGTRATVCDEVTRRLDVATEGLGFGVDSLWLMLVMGVAVWRYLTRSAEMKRLVGAVANLLPVAPRPC